MSGNVLNFLKTNQNVYRTFTISYGVLQGSILGSRLLNFISHLWGVSSGYTEYADDTQLNVAMLSDETGSINAFKKMHFRYLCLDVTEL